jgi:hypothetical protein
LAAGAAEAAAPSTMRVDYYHTGNAAEEHFSLDRVIVEPLPWPGNPAKPIDTTDRGKYFFEVVDAATGRTVFSRGFSSIYGEWETTGEAKVATSGLSQSIPPTSSSTDPEQRPPQARSSRFTRAGIRPTSSIC